MTTEQKPEAGEVIGFERDGRMMTIYFRASDGNSDRFFVTPAELADAGFVPAASLAAAEARVAELTAELEPMRRAFGDLNDGCVELEKQLASERAGREHLEQAAALWREYRRTDTQWDWGVVRAWHTKDDELRASTPAPPSEGPASPVAEGAVAPVPSHVTLRLPWMKGPHGSSAEFVLEGVSVLALADNGFVSQLALTTALNRRDRLSKELATAEAKLRAQAAERDALLRWCHEQEENAIRICDKSTDPVAKSHQNGRESAFEQVSARLSRSQPTPTVEAKELPSTRLYGGKAMLVAPTGEEKGHAGIQKNAAGDSHRSADGGSGGVRASELPPPEAMSDVQPVGDRAADRGGFDAVADCGVSGGANRPPCTCGAANEPDYTPGDCIYPCPRATAPVGDVSAARCQVHEPDADDDGFGRCTCVPSPVAPAAEGERRCPFGCLQTSLGEPCICAGCRPEPPPASPPAKLVRGHAKECNGELDPDGGGVPCDCPGFVPADDDEECDPVNGQLVSSRVGYQPASDATWVPKVGDEVERVGRDFRFVGVIERIDDQPSLNHWVRWQTGSTGNYDASELRPASPPQPPPSGQGPTETLTKALSDAEYELGEMLRQHGVLTSANMDPSHRFFVALLGCVKELAKPAGTLTKDELVRILGELVNRGGIIRPDSPGSWFGKLADELAKGVDK